MMVVVTEVVVELHSSGSHSLLDSPSTASLMYKGSAVTKARPLSCLRSACLMSWNTMETTRILRWFATCDSHCSYLFTLAIFRNPHQQAKPCLLMLESKRVLRRVCQTKTARTRTVCTHAGTKAHACNLKFISSKLRNSYKCVTLTCVGCCVGSVLVIFIASAVQDRCV